MYLLFCLKSVCCGSLEEKFDDIHLYESLLLCSCKVTMRKVGFCAAVERKFSFSAEGSRIG